MSLATNAALFNDDHSSLLGPGSPPLKSFQDTAKPSSSQKRSRTQKVYPKENFDSKKVSSMLERIHSSNAAADDADEDDAGGEDDADNEGTFFRPPPMPQSMGGTRKARENLKLGSTGGGAATDTEEGMTVFGGVPKPTYIEKNDLTGHSYADNYTDEKGREDYYRSVMPGYQAGQGQPQMKGPYNRFEQYNAKSGGAVGGDILTQKMNYMIHLLEEQQDQKTGSITEEVVLYSFLGIFIIFIADSFVRVGKYGKYIR